MTRLSLRSCAVWAVTLSYAVVLGDVPAHAQTGALPPGLAQAVSEARHAIEPLSGAAGYEFQAQNPGSRLRFRFGSAGLLVEPRTAVPEWRLDMRVEAYGQEGVLSALPSPVLNAAGRRIEYRRGALVEWYVNGAGGLEQGFTLPQPKGYDPSRPVVLAIALEGELTPRLAAGGTGIGFYKGDGAVAFDYDQLKTFDATGKVLPSRMVVADGRLEIRIEAGEGHWPVTVDPVISCQNKLVASDGATDDQFGISVALSSDGSTALVGASRLLYGTNEGPGFVYVFTHSGAAWTQQAKLAAFNSEGDDFGIRLALSSDGNTALVGAWRDDVGSNLDQGSAYVFTRSGTTWTQQAKLAASDGAAGDYFGISVSLSSDGSTALVAAHFDDIGANLNQGSVYIFTRSGSNWTQQAKLVASDGTGVAGFGVFADLSSDGNTALIGAFHSQVGANPYQGSAYVFTRSGVNWTQQARLTAADGAAGDYFGANVALSGDGSTALVACREHDVGANADQGSAYVFSHVGATWTQQAKLTAADGAAEDLFGESVAISDDGSTALVGAGLHDIGANADQGSLYVFTRKGATWTQQAKLAAPDGAASDRFGFSVALSADGNLALVGAPLDDVGSTADQGSAYAFALNLPSKLPESGQSKCYQGVPPYAEIACAGTGQDGEYAQNPMSYTDSGDGIVTDSNTGLEWQQEYGNTYNWYEASGTYHSTSNPSAVDVCGSLRLGGYTDWRLPSKKELVGIVDYAGSDLSIDTDFFPGTMASVYWTSDTTASSPGGAFGVDFDGGFGGSTRHVDKVETMYVRCVRGERSASPDHLVPNGDGTVTDANTGLVWQQGEPGSMSWSGALSYCAGLTIGGSADWRLPNVKELESLTEEARSAPAIDTAQFPNANSEYWSSTTHAADASDAWHVDFTGGNLGFFVKASGVRVRCVRGGEAGALGDLVPVPFSFTDQTGAALNVPVASGPITVTGTTGPSPIFIVGGEYSVDGGAYTSEPGTVVNGSQVRVRVTSSASSETAAVATLTIGGVSDTFSATTNWFPTVTISATDAAATEAGNTTGQFTVTRTGSTSSPLTVKYTVGGTATAGSDYQALTGSVTIGAGASTATITVTPIDDAIVEGDEIIVATLDADAAYAVGSSASATVTIYRASPAEARGGSYSTAVIDLDAGKILGARPLALGINTATKKLYVGNTNGVISVFNSTTDTLLATIRFGAGNHSEIQDLVVDRAANRVYVTDADGFLVVIDGESDTIAARIPMATPWRIAVHPTNGRVYVTNYGTAGNDGNNTVTVVRAATNTVEATVTVGKNPWGLGIAGDKVFVANEGSGSASVIDAKPSSARFNTVLATIPISGADSDWGPADVAVNAGANTVYILCRGDVEHHIQTSFAVIDATTNTLANFNGAPRNPVLVPNTYWSNGFALRNAANVVAVRNTSDVNGNDLHTFSSWSANSRSWVLTGPVEELGAPITAWGGAEALKRLYVLAGGIVSVVDIDGTQGHMDHNHVIASVTAGFETEHPRALAVGGAGDAVYASGGDANSVAVINYGDNTLRGRDYTGGGPGQLAVDSSRNTVWVGHLGGGLDGAHGVRRIDGVALAVTSIATGTGGWWPALLGESANRVYTFKVIGDPQGLIPIDGATNEVFPVIPIDFNHINEFVVNQVTRRIYLTFEDGRLVVVNIDPASPGYESVEATVALGGRPDTIAVNGADNWVYVLNDGYVSAVNGATNTVAATFPLAWNPTINQTTKRLYLCSEHLGSPALKVVDVDPAHASTFNTVVAVMPMAAVPTGLMINETTNRVYVFSLVNGTISVMDGATGILEATIPIPGLTDDANGALDEGLGRLYLLDGEHPLLYVIDANPDSARFNTILQSIDMGRTSPTSLGVNTTTHQVYVASYMGNSVTVFTPHPLVFAGDSFTWQDDKGRAICTGSIGTSESPYWPYDDYRVADAQIADVDGDGSPEAVVIGNHATEYPGQVAVFGAGCLLERRYWNPGHLASLQLHDVNADGTPEILVGGSNVDSAAVPAPAVFALDGRTLAGEAPPRSGKIGTGAELWYRVLSETEAAAVQRLTFSEETLVCNTRSDGSGSEYQVRLADGSLVGTPQTLELAEAVDNTTQVFTTGGKANWWGQAEVQHEGGDAARSGKVTGNQSSSLETTVSGPAAGSFWWKVSSEATYDLLKFTVDGKPVAEVAPISGTVDWKQESWRIETAGSHVLRWEYAKDASIESGSDAGWVDQVVVGDLPAGSLVIDGGAVSAKTSTVTLTLSASDADGVSEMRFRNDAAANWSDAQPHGPTKSWTLSAGDGVKTVFAQFKDAAGNWSAPASDTIVLDTSNLGEAVDNTALDFTRGGDAGWSSQSAIFHAGGDAARSGAIEDGQVSWFETTVASQAGSFWWRVSSEEGYDTLRFLVDGKLRQEISGAVAWQKVSWSIETAGSHVLRWEYVKDALMAAGSDCGWVDEIVVGAAPTGSVVIAGGAAATASAGVGLTLAASDVDGVTQMRLRNEGQADWTSPEPYATTRSWVLSPGDGTKEVSVQFQDGTGLWSGPFSDTVALDTTGPAGSVQINAGAPGTAAVGVTLSLAYPDTNGCSQMQLSGDGVFDTEPITACAPTKPWTLPSGDGAKTVFAKFKDGLGNWSGPFNDTIALDTVPPSVSIAKPADGSTVTKVRTISGAASDAHLSRVELQVYDGALYLTAASGWSATPQWLRARGTQSWAYDTSRVVWANGEYTVQARAVDVAGRSAVSSAHFHFDVASKAYTTLDMELSSQTIKQNDTVDVAGSLIRLPQASAPLEGLAVDLTVTDPDGETVPVQIIDDQGAVVSVSGTSTYDAFGHFILGKLTGFTKKGVYTIQASFAGTDNLADSVSEHKTVLVGASAGYAIIVAGKVASGEGLASHNKTAGRAYQALLGRGFVGENITFLSYGTTQEGVDGAPTKAALRSAIAEWARDRMNAVAAPLYLVMVDHGNPGAFYLNNEFVSPEDLNAWLGTLEGSLNAAALKEARIVIDGSCYSGSFIPVLSKAGRVIIASAAGDEQSYKGLNEPDNVRSGEFFLEEFFKELDKGYSLKDAFVNATERTEIFTRRGGSANSATSSKGYADDAAQHPLLDDDGDQVGSNVLSDDAGDGLVAAAIYLGVGQTNAVANPAEFSSVKGTQHLGPLETQVALWGTLESNASNVDVSTAWVEIRKPSTVLSGSGGSGQLEVNIPKVLLKLKNGGRWECGLNGALTGEKCSFTFDESGKYEVYYATRRAATGEISSLKRSLVYKDKAGNGKPDSFNLVAPANATTGLTVLLLDWEESVDPDGNAVTYTVMVSRDDGFASVDLVKEGLSSSELALGTDVGLEDLTTYFWKVLAVDPYGATRSSAVWSFTTNNTNPELPGFVQGCVTDAISRAAVGSPSVSSSYGSVAVGGNCYTISSSPGPVTISVSARGYQSATVGATVPSGTSARVNVSLTPVQFNLTVVKAGNGSGLVAGGGTCTAGTSVTVNAYPAADSIFGGWGGACAGTSPTTSVVMNGDRTCTATFLLNQHQLSVSKTGNGAGTVTGSPAGIACGTSCTQVVMDGVTVSLAAVPATGSLFTGWGAACGGSGASCALTMNGAKSVSARFMAKVQELTVATSGRGSGGVSVDKGAILWQGTTGKGAYDYGTPVTLTAWATFGSYFNGWTGACSGTAPVCTVTLDDARNVSAEFKLTIQELQVTVQGLGSGYVTVDEGGISWAANVGTARYEFGTEVSLRALADAGSFFGGWGGAVQGQETRATLKMLGPRNVTAFFTPEEVGTVEVSGQGLQVDGRPFAVKGVVYSPVPVGEDPGLAPYGDYFTSEYSQMYDADLAHLRRMNANTVRLLRWNGAADHSDFLTKAYNGGVDPIRVIVGYGIDAGRQLSNSAVRTQITEDFRAMVAAHKSEPAVLMWAIGDGLNAPGVYGGDQANLFSLVNQMAQAAHAEDPSHPVTMPLADHDLIATIATQDGTTSLDLWGANACGDDRLKTLFTDFKAASAKPLVVLGYGADAYDETIVGGSAVGENEQRQADSVAAQWLEIQARGDVCAGGAVREYSDEWWRGRLADPACADAGAHDTCGSASGSAPDGYDNVEWWGLTAVAAGAAGADSLRERAASGRLRELYWSSAGALTINGGASHTGSRSVALAIKVPAGARQMCVGNGGACSVWAEAAAAKAWMLESGDGEKTVSVRFKDGEDAVMPETASDTIVLDTTAPTDGPVTWTPGEAKITIAWGGFSDGGSGARGHKVVCGAASVPDSCGAGTTLYEGSAASYEHLALTNAPYYYRVCATDKVGNVSAGVAWSGKPLQEYVEPTGSIEIDDDGKGVTKSTAVHLKLTASDDSPPLQMCISNTNKTACTAWTAFTKSKPWTLTAGNGTKTVYAWFKDAWGNDSPVTDTTYLDTVAPANVKLTATADAVGGQITLRWPDYDEVANGVVRYQVVYAAGVAPATCTAGSLVPGYGGTSKEYIHTGLTNQVYGYRVCAVDKAGNSSPGSTVSNRPTATEKIAPSGSIAINSDAVWTKSATVILTPTATDSSPPLQMCLSNTNTTTCTAWQAFAATKSWKLTAGNGTKTVYAWFKDAWGNATPKESPAVDMINLDATLPVNGKVTASPGAGRIALSWSGFSDAPSDVAGYKLVYAAGSPPATCASGAAVPGYDGTGTSCTHAGLSNQAYGYRVCAIDKAGNMSAGATVSAKPSRTENMPPFGSVSINDGAEWTKKAGVTLTLAATDDSPPLQMCVSNTAKCTTWTAFATSKPWVLSAGNGPKTINVWFRDTWGNATPAGSPHSDTIKLDTTAPGNGTVTAEAGPGSITLTWPEFIDPYGSIGGYKVVYAAGSAPASCVVGTVVEECDGPNPERSCTHAGLGNKTYGYRICAVDSAGNLSRGAVANGRPEPSESDPPTDSSVAINNGKEATKSTAATLTLKARDASLPLQVCVSSTDTVPCAVWTSFPGAETTKKWTLSAGNGTKAVYAWFKDDWGAVTGPVRDTIVLDTAPPTGGSVTGTPASSQIGLSWDGFDGTGSSIAGYQAVFAKGSVPVSCATGTALPGYGGTSESYTHTGLANGTLYGYRVCAIDGAGNVSAGATWSGKPNQ